MRRTLEPEIMGDAEQSRAYASADFSTSNQSFVDQVVAAFGPSLKSIIDIGCGPCDVMIRLASACPSAHITAIDGSAAMIDLAQSAVRAANLQSRISPMVGYIPGLALRDHSFDAVLSKDLLHHLPDPQVLWREVLRLGRSGGAVCIMDLIRPENIEDARNTVERVAPHETRILKEDFFNSLCAAFTVEEVQAQLREARLPLSAARMSDRHMLVKGVLA